MGHEHQFLPLQKMNQSVMVTRSKYENKKGVWVWPFNKYPPWMMVQEVSRLGKLNDTCFNVNLTKLTSLALMLIHDWISSFSHEFIMCTRVYHVNSCTNLKLTFKFGVKRDVALELFIAADLCLKLDGRYSCNLVATTCLIRFIYPLSFVPVMMQKLSYWGIL